MGSKFKTTKEFDDFCRSVERDSLLFDVNKIVNEAKEKAEESKYDIEPIKIIDDEVSFEDKEKRIPFKIEIVDITNSSTLDSYVSLVDYNSYSETRSETDEYIVQPKEGFISDIANDFDINKTELDCFNIYLSKIKFTSLEESKENKKYITEYYYCLVYDGELIVLSDAWNLAEANEIVISANIHDIKFDSLDWNNVYQEAKKHMLETGYITSIIDK